LKYAPGVEIDPSRQLQSRGEKRWNKQRRPGNGKIQRSVDRIKGG